MLEKIVRNVKVVGIGGLIGLSVLSGCSKSDEGTLIVDVKRGEGSSIYLDGALVKQISNDGSRDLDLKLKPGSYEVRVENEDYPNNYEERVAIIKREELKLNVDLGKTYKETEREIELDKYGSPERTIKTYLSILSEFAESNQNDSDIEQFIDDSLGLIPMNIKILIPNYEKDLRRNIYKELKNGSFSIDVLDYIYILSPTLVEFIDTTITEERKIIKICPTISGEICLVPRLYKKSIKDSNGKALFSYYCHIDDSSGQFSLNTVSLIKEGDLWKIFDPSGKEIIANEIECED